MQLIGVSLMGLLAVGCMFSEAAYDNDFRFFDYDYLLEPNVRNSRQIGQDNSYRCSNEGTFHDNANCRRFYRCVPNGNGGYIPYAFECSVGTVYEPAIGVCIHPYASSREECGGNDIEPPRPIQTFSTTVEPIISSSSSYWSSSTSSFESNDTSTVASAPNRCTSAGFRQDLVNCRKFYRCIDNGLQGYTQYEFICAPGTIFDPSAITCNYPSAVKRIDCTQEADGGQLLLNNARNSMQSSIGTWQESTTNSFAQNSSSTFSNSTSQASSSSSSSTSSSSSSSYQNSTTSSGQNSGSNSGGQFNQQGSGNQSSSSGQSGDNWQSSTQQNSSINNNQQSSLSGQQQGFNNNQQSGWESSSNQQSSSSNNNQQQSGSSSSQQSSSNNNNQQSGGSSTSNQQSSNNNNNQQQSGSSSSQQSSSNNNNQQSGGSSTSNQQSSNSNNNQQQSGSSSSQQSSSNNNNQQSGGSSTSNQQSSNSNNNQHQSGSSSSQQSSSSNNNQQSGGSTSNQQSTSNNNSQQQSGSSSSQQSSNNNISQQTGGSSNQQSSSSNNNQQSGGSSSSEETSSNNQQSGSSSIQQGSSSTSNQQTTGNSNSEQSGSQETSNQSGSSSSSGSQSGSSSSSSSSSSNQSGSTQSATNQSGSSQGSSSGSSSSENNQGGSNANQSGTSSSSSGSNISETSQSGSTSSGGNQSSGSNQSGSSSATSGSNQNGSSTSGQTGSNSENNQSSGSAFNQTGTNTGSTQGSTSQQTGQSSNQIGSGGQLQKQPGAINSNGYCVKEGFVNDEKDCNKFYRCVSDQRGILIKHEFTCPNNTVWDQTELSCSYPYLVTGRCYAAQPGLPSSEGGSGNQIQTPGQTTQQPPQLGPSTERPGQLVNNQCASSGFLGDNQNCKKFYRCVENGQGGYIKHEFSCGNGTVWDQEAQTCNYPYYVRGPCYAALPQNQGGTEASSEIETQEAGSSSSSQSQQTGSTSNQNQETGSSGTTSGQNQNNNQSWQTGTNQSNQENQQTGSTSQTQQGSNNQSGQEGIDQSTSSQSQQNQNQQTGTQQTTGGQGGINQPSGSSGNQPTTEKPGLLVNNQCALSGFVGDSEICKKFYRCVENGQGGYIKYEFTCVDGTVWDNELQTCNYASSVRGRCNSAQSGVTSSTGSSSEGSNQGGSTQSQGGWNQQGSQQETGSNQQQSGSGIGSQGTSGSTSQNQGGWNQQGSQQQAGSGSNQQQSGNQGGSSTGGTSQNQGGWNQQGTQQQTGSGPNQQQSGTQGGGLNGGTPQNQGGWNQQGSQQQTGSGSNQQQSGNQGGSSTGGTSQNQGGWNQQGNQQQTGSGSNQQPSGTTSGNQGSSTTGTSQNQGGWNQQGAQQTTGGSTGSEPTTSMTNPAGSATQGQLTNNLCSQGGFVGDDQSCQKFYRCVENGQGGYIKYEYLCGNGTVWDQSILSCSHAFLASGNCYQPASPENIQSTQTGTSNQSSSSNQPIYPNGPSQATGSTQPNQPYQPNSPSQTTYPNGSTQSTGSMQTNQPYQPEMASQPTYPNKPLQPISPSQPNQPTGPTQQPEPPTDQPPRPTTEGPGQLINDQCASSGFVGDQRNCKKFYRCVDNGRGGFTKYEYKCGDATVWDQDSQTCNYPYAVRGSCYSSQSGIPNHGQAESRPNGPSQPSHSNQPTTPNLTNVPNQSNVSQQPTGITQGPGPSQSRPNEPYQPSGSNQPSGTGTPSVPQPTGQNTSSVDRPCNCKNQTSTEQVYPGAIVNNQCVKEGYVEDEQNCAKFYRCVNTGQSLIKYEYSCGTGTVWDQSIFSCNHPSAVRGRCSQTSSQVPEGPGNTNQLSPASNETSPISSGSCTQDGYMGHGQNCSRFYRCVASGSGGYIQHEFSCGPGTVWDQERLTCNHPWEVEGVCRNQAPVLGSTTLPGSEITTTTTGYPTKEESSSTVRPTDSWSTSTPVSVIESSTENFGTTPFTTSTLINEPTTLLTTDYTPEYTTESSTLYFGSTTTLDLTGISTNKEIGSTFSSFTEPTTETTILTSEPTTTEIFSTLDELGTLSTTEITLTDSDIQSTTEFSESTSTVIDQTVTTDIVSTTDLTYNTESPATSTIETITILSTTLTPTYTETSTNILETAVTENSSLVTDSTETVTLLSTTVTLSTESDRNTESTTFLPYTESSTQQLHAIDTTIVADGGTTTTLITESTETDHTSPVTVESTTAGQSFTERESTTISTENSSAPESSTLSVVESSSLQPEQTTQITEKIDILSTTTLGPYETTLNIEGSTSVPELTTLTQLATTEPNSELNTVENTELPNATLESTTLWVVESSSFQPQQTTQTTEEISTLSTTTFGPYETTLNTESSTLVPEQTTFTQLGTAEPNSELNTPSTVENTELPDTILVSSTTIFTPFTMQTVEPSNQTEHEVVSTEQNTDSTSIDIGTEQSTFENTESTTGFSTTTGGNGTHMAECPIGQLEGDQIALVCPTGFRRHPKYCNLFYQCTSNDGQQNFKILVLSCPQGTIFDDKKIQCLPEGETLQTCTGQIAQSSLYRMLDINALPPINVPTKRSLCPYEGSHEMEPTECSEQFLKCQRNHRKMEGFLYQCPEGFAYWQITRQCERTAKLLHCAGYKLERSKWQIPIETTNVSYRRRKELSLPL